MSIKSKWAGPPARSTNGLSNQHQEKTWGKGCWKIIHFTAIYDDQTNNKVFCKWIRNFVTKIPCKDCSDHATKYVTDNPPEKTLDLLLWTINFHNAVNKRLGKPQIPVNEAKVICTRLLTDNGWEEGYWISIHQTAVYENTTGIRLFPDWFRFMVSRIGNPEWVRNINEYMLRTAPEDADDVFVWSWTLHNIHNMKNGKPNMGFETARDLFYGGKIKELCASCNG